MGFSVRKPNLNGRKHSMMNCSDRFPKQAQGVKECERVRSKNEIYDCQRDFVVKQRSADHLRKIRFPKQIVTESTASDHRSNSFAEKRITDAIVAKSNIFFGRRARRTNNLAMVNEMTQHRRSIDAASNPTQKRRPRWGQFPMR